MTIYADLPMVDAPAPQPGRRWSRRRVMTAAAVAVVLLAILGSGIGWAVYANTYAPLGRGAYGSVGGRGLSVLTDGVTDTRLALFGEPGARGVMETSISNDGSHAVRLLGVDRKNMIDEVSVQWGPEFGPGNVVGGRLSQARPFPVTLAPHRTLSLWISITKPGCAQGEDRELPTLPLRWVALGVHHVYQLNFDDDTHLPVALCPPAKAQQHIDHFFS